MVSHEFSIMVYASVTLCIVAKRYISQQKRLNKKIGSPHRKTI